MYKVFSNLLSGGMAGLGIEGLSEFDFTAFSIGGAKTTADLLEDGPICPVCGERHDIGEEDDRVQNTQDDYAGDVTTTGVLDANTSLSGTIEVAGDADWFFVSIPAGTWGVRFYLLGGDAAGELFDPLLSLHATDGTFLQSYSQDGFTTPRPQDSDAVFGSLPDATRDYFLSAESQDGGTGTYTIGFDLFADDHHNWVFTTSTVAVGDTVTARSDYRGDWDMFAFTVAAGDAVAFESPTFNAYFFIHDASGAVLADGVSGTVQFADAGTYYIGAYGFDVGNDYTFSLSSTTVADDYAGDTTTTGTISLGETVFGFTDFASDADWFAYTATAGEETVFSRNVFGLVEIYDAQGNYVTGADGHVVHTFADAGTYFISTESPYEEAYELSAATFVDDFAGDASTTGVVTLDGAAVSGQLNFVDDHDWFAFTLTETTAILFDANALADMNIRDANGDYAGYAFNSEVVELAAGTYFVDVSSFVDPLTAYTLSLRTVVDDFAGDTTTTGTVALDGSVSGNIDFEDDEDWFALNVAAGTTAILNTGLGSVIEVFDASGTFLEGVFDGESYTFAAGGDYFIGVTSFATGAYSLAVSSVADDFADDTSTTGVITLGGSVSGRIDFAGDRDWFAITVDAGDITQLSTGLGGFIDIFDATGALVGDVFDGETYSFGDAGTYFVSVGGYQTGAYTLSASEAIVDDYSADTTTTGTLTVDGSATGSIDYNYDRDWFAISVDAGDIINFANSLGAFIDIYDATGLYVGGIGSGSTFNFTDAGTYFVEVGSYSISTYTLSASRVVDDYAGDTTTTGTISLGGSVSGSIDFSYDQDWFAFTVDAGDLISFTNSQGSFMSIYDGNGDIFTSTNPDEAVEFAAGGTYYVTLDTSFVSTYTLSASTPLTDDFAGDITTTGTLAVGGTATGNIDYANDSDWFAITVAAGENVLVANDAFNILTLYDSLGNFVASDNGFGELTITSGGDYFVAIEAFTPGSYTLTATAFTDDYAGDATTTGAVALGGTSNGTIEVTGDSDWFAIEVVAGEQYTVTAASTDLFGPTVQLFDSAGSFLGGTVVTNNDGVFTVNYTANATGTIFAGVTDTFGGTGAYAVEFDTYTPPVDDYAGDTSTTGVVEAGGSVTGSLEVQDDRDWFALSVEAGTTYVIDLRADPNGTSPLNDPYLRLYDDAGVLITENDDFNGLESQITFTATTTGTVFVGAGGFGGQTGDYEVSVAVDGPPQPIDPTGAVSVAIGDRASGTLAVEGDMDIYAIDVVAGQSYTFFLIRDTQDALQNPMLGLYDANGDFVMSNDDIAQYEWNSRIDYTATETVTIYLTAQSSDGANTTLTNFIAPDHSGGYTLYVENSDERADFTATEVAGFLTNSFSPFMSVWQSDTITYDISALPAEEQSLALMAMQAWADLTPLNFVEAGAGEIANITFQDTDLGTAYATSLGPNSSGQVVINVGSDWSNGASDIDSYTFQTYLHEVGHALGLGHSGAYNAGGGVPITYEDSRLYNQDYWTMTLMSYFPQSVAGTGDYRFVLTPQEADIIAIQSLYGANTTTRGGDTTYGFNSTEAGSVYDFSVFSTPPAITIYDTGGVDTIDLSGYSGDQMVTLEAGVRSDIGGSPGGGVLSGILNIMGGSVIENLIGGSGNDLLTGNGADNVIEGGDGNDALIGGAGHDTLDGGSGTNSLFGGDGNDILVMRGAGDTIDGGAGLDRVQFVNATDQNVTFNLINGFVISDLGRFAMTSIEGAVGTAFDDIFVGSAAVNFIDGGAGVDRINGGDGGDVLRGGTGDDIVNGQEGDDTLRGQEGADLLNGGIGDDVLDGGLGSDRLIGAAGADTLQGGDGDDVLFGDNGDDVLEGGSGADMLQGGAGADTADGGAGADTMLGGAGDDVLLGGDDDDLILGMNDDDRLEGGAGDDVLRGGAGDDVLFGGSGADRLLGEAGLDVLHGGGGADELFGLNGADRLFGEGGDDFLSGGAGADVVSGGAGRDRLNGGADADILLGGADADVLIGGDGDDALDGGGGSNTVYGGAGLDVFDRSGAGTDVIQDFTSGEDRIALSDSIMDFDDLLANAQDTNAGVRITNGNDGIYLLVGLTVAELTNDDFIYGDWIA